MARTPLRAAAPHGRAEVELGTGLGLAEGLELSDHRAVVLVHHSTTTRDRAGRAPEAVRECAELAVAHPRVRREARGTRDLIQRGGVRRTRNVDELVGRRLAWLRVRAR